MGLQDDKVTGLVNLIQTRLTNENADCQRLLKVGLQKVVIPAGQIKHVKCKVPPSLDVSSQLVLFEPNENNPTLQQLWEVVFWLSVNQNPHLFRSQLLTTINMM
ncbi:hypothetical protein GOODEAATRI_009005 [Goodea atripinnis]|uniref:Uncharacterized protein n=2 Tax=Goodeidae TaxID=28758 RepID=A0ABV0NSZ6_9TELE